MRRSPRACGWRGGGAGAWRVLLAVAFLLLWGAEAQTAAQGPPGQEAGAHEVRRGDTLWDLARRYLSNPVLWPQIFEVNRDVVEDPHWIYPGEVLRLPAAAARDAASLAATPAWPAERQEAQEAQETQPGTAARRSVSGFGGSSVFDQSPTSGDVLGELQVDDSRPSPLVSPSDFYRAPFVATPETIGPVAMTARKIEENPLGLSLPPAIRKHHRVVLDLNGLPVEEGAVLQAFRWQRALRGYGRVATPLALLEVESVGRDSARAVVVDLFGNYQVGDAVIAAERFDWDGRVAQAPVESGPVARVIGFETDRPLLGRGDMVFLEVGRGAGVELGDEFAVFSASERRADRAPWNERVASVRVVKVGSWTATAVVVDLQDVGVDSGAPARLVFRASGG